MNVGELNATHLGRQVTVYGFKRADRSHDITGTLRDVTHLSAGRMSTVWLDDWTATPPLAAWVSPGGWMVRQEQKAAAS